MANEPQTLIGSSVPNGERSSLACTQIETHTRKCMTVLCDCSLQQTSKSSAATHLFRCPLLGTSWNCNLSFPCPSRVNNFSTLFHTFPHLLFRQHQRALLLVQALAARHLGLQQLQLLNRTGQDMMCQSRSEDGQRRGEGLRRQVRMERAQSEIARRPAVLQSALLCCFFPHLAPTLCLN